MCKVFLKFFFHKETVDRELKLGWRKSWNNTINSKRLCIKYGCEIMTNLFHENISLRLTKASSTVYFAEREKTVLWTTKFDYMKELQC